MAAAARAPPGPAVPPARSASAARRCSADCREPKSHRFRRCPTLAGGRDLLGIPGFPSCPAGIARPLRWRKRRAPGGRLVVISDSFRHSTTSSPASTPNAPSYPPAGAHGVDVRTGHDGRQVRQPRTPAENIADPVDADCKAELAHCMDDVIARQSVFRGECQTAHPLGVSHAADRGQPFDARAQAANVDAISPGSRRPRG